jgi:hypothetical protein
MARTRPRSLLLRLMERFAKRPLMVSDLISGCSNRLAKAIISGRA